VRSNPTPVIPVTQDTMDTSSVCPYGDASLSISFRESNCVFFFLANALVLFHTYPLSPISKLRPREAWLSKHVVPLKVWWCWRGGVSRRDSRRLLTGRVLCSSVSVMGITLSGSWRRHQRPWRACFMAEGLHTRAGEAPYAKGQSPVADA
jgi:hypothetical protein